jgi:hypothetical protein
MSCENCTCGEAPCVSEFGKEYTKLRGHICPTELPACGISREQAALQRDECLSCIGGEHA